MTKISAARQANLDRMAEVLYDLGGTATAQRINEEMGICAIGEKSPAGEALYRDAKGDARYYKPVPRVGSYALKPRAKAAITKARKAVAVA